MDLDNEELKATRKLNGVAKESNIEEDVKFIKEMVKEYNTFGDLDNLDYEDTDKIYKAIENILEEREQDQKRIKKLEDHFKKYYNGELYTAKQLKQIEENQKKYFIPVQKVKDKIEKLNKEIKNSDEIEAIFKIKQQQILQELLEDK